MNHRIENGSTNEKARCSRKPSRLPPETCWNFKAEWIRSQST